MASSAETLQTNQPTIDRINNLAIEARARIADFVEISPVFVSDHASHEHALVSIKDETMQPGRSFKDRGAGNAVFAHAENGEELVITASAGNHGQGLARAAREKGIDAIVVVGNSASFEKKNKIKRHDVELIEHGQNFDDALEYGLELALARSGRFVHPFADELVVAGQATIGLELLEQEPDMTHLVLPAGGGGLLAGVASVIKENKENVKIIAAQVSGNTAFVDSLWVGRPLTSQPTDTRFEGIAVGNIHPMTYEIARQTVDQAIIIDTPELYRAIYDFRNERKTLLETAGAVGLAAAQKVALGLSEESRIITIATGANPPKILESYVEARARRFGW